MNHKPVFFGEAMQRAVQALQTSGVPIEKALVIRDIYGRVRIALDYDQGTVHGFEESLNEGLSNLGVYQGGSTKPVLFHEDFLNFDDIFNDSGVLSANLPGTNFSFRLLDRQIIGQDWLRPTLNDKCKIPRLVFYGFKGGVGRSTAMVMLAYALAQKGKRVLLLDLDLESPGLSGLLLPPERLADFGLVDWFVEDAVGQGDLVKPRMIVSSPLAQDLAGDIRIGAAMGSTSKEQYLAKLSRVYADTNHEGQQELFAHRVLRLVRDLEALENPDVVLIDSRAGLHDLAAISLVGLASRAFLFATDSAQSWQGYDLLFSHWRAFPQTLKAIRNQLAMVYALFPENDQANRAKLFLEHAYNLYVSNLYEEIPPGDTSNDEVFNYALTDEDAPHKPVHIRWNPRFQEFDPLLLTQGIVTEEDIRLTFGPFIDRVMEELPGEDDE